MTLYQMLKFCAESGGTAHVEMVESTEDIRATIRFGRDSASFLITKDMGLNTIMEDMLRPVLIALKRHREGIVRYDAPAEDGFYWGFDTINGKVEDGYQLMRWVGAGKEQGDGVDGKMLDAVTGTEIVHYEYIDKRVVGPEFRD